MPVPTEVSDSVKYREVHVPEVTEVAGIHHLVDGLGVMDVGPYPVLVAVEPTVRRAVPIEVCELHPESDLGRLRSIQARPYRRDAPPR